MTNTRVAVLGGGPAGLGAAWQLMQQRKARAVVIEQRGLVGGNAGSFEIDGLPVDYGSHRLHPACHPEILSDLRRLLKDELCDRPRHGRIRLRKRWLHFPLKPADLILNLPPSFGLGVTWDSLQKVALDARRRESDTFASVLQRGLGKTICRDFYFPYATKMWGVSAEELSPVQAYRRVSAGSLGKMVRKVLGLVPGFKSQGAGRFYYPRQGFGQISQTIASEACKLGAEMRLGTKVRNIRLGKPLRVEVDHNGTSSTIEAEHVWSTIPINLLARIVDPPPPPEVLQAAQNIKFRSMILIYLVLAQPQFTPFDAHYFPEIDIQLTRLSEPKNYSGRLEPADRTVLCGELPCMLNDSLWNSSDDELAEVVKASLARCGLPVRVPIVKIVTKRLAAAYPIYHLGYESHFSLVSDWLAGLDGILTFGRQGLFAHDNTHHALAMAYAAVDCLQESGNFDAARWKDYLKEFSKHVVED